MNIYKKYVETSSPKGAKPLNKSFSNQTILSDVSSYSIISGVSKSPQHLKDNVESLKRSAANLKIDGKAVLDRFFCSPNELNCDPLKKLEERNLSIYLNFLNVGMRGATQPSEKNVNAYEAYVKQLKLG